MEYEVVVPVPDPAVSLGLKLVSENPVCVDSVTPGGLVAGVVSRLGAGALLPDDMIVSVNGEAHMSAAAVRLAMDRAKASGQLVLRLRRQRTVGIQLEPFAAAAAPAASALDLASPRSSGGEA
jgi:hypothetical protein